MTVLIRFYFYRLLRTFRKITVLILFITFQSTDYLQIPHKITYGLWILYFLLKIEFVQYYAALAITGVIRSSSREIRYHELGLGDLHHRRWMKSFCSQSLSSKVSKYIHDLVPAIGHCFRYLSLFTSFPCRLSNLRILFFLAL